MARKILLADDSVTAQNMGRRILNDAGYEVITVNNGSAALKRIAESKPDLIVLDVYMPGYGGLEVCQRLREAPETARIPVLLTVGKLEPFKADEARRVRADAFIVKPFEASELLTALTKLEDKIVPQSHPTRQSRFAKALAGIEDQNSSKEFGDSDTGWKSRLSIPRPQSKPREVAPEEPAAVAASSPEPVRIEESKPADMKSGLEEALLSSMPQDVTAEEIAAIKAAAAAFSAPGNESGFGPHLVSEQVNTSTIEPVDKIEETVSESVGGQSPGLVPPGFVSPVIEKTTTSEPQPAAEVPAQTMPPVEAIVSGSPSAYVAAETGKLGTEEVTAALASLAPMNGHGDSIAADKAIDTQELESRDLVPVTMAVAGATHEFSGPRWIAEPVPLGDDEATLALDEEMEKAYAAFAAAAGGTGSASRPAEEAYSRPNIAEAGIAPSSAEAISNADSSELRPDAPRETAAIKEESEKTEAEVAPVVTSPVADLTSESVASQAKENSAFAAAASANGGVEAKSNADAVAQPRSIAASPENVTSTTESNRQPAESELAAAWENWKQVRVSVIGSQIGTSQGPDSPVNGSQPVSPIASEVAEFHESSRDGQPDSPADQAKEEDSSEISSIVDSMLADLKPKLMAEIAKKMGKESRKK